MNVLDIDPKNLGSEFDREWSSFIITKPHKFLRALLEMKIECCRRELETVSSEKLASVQGALTELKKLLGILEKNNVFEQLKQVITYLEK